MAKPDYVSDADKLLESTRQRIQESAAHKAERLKHQRIADLRDNPKSDESGQTIWEDF